MDAAVWDDGTIARVWFDESRVYRYMLERDFRQESLFQSGSATDEAKQLTFIMVNPSTADALRDDKTVARCGGFARRWGYKRMRVVNLFALRSTDPRALTQHPEPIGPENDDAILRAVADSDLVIAAWGTHGALRNRGEEIRHRVSAVKPLFCFQLTKAAIRFTRFIKRAIRGRCCGMPVESYVDEGKDPS